MSNPNGLVAALAKAQAEMKNPALNKVNPHFKNKYADLPAVRDAVVPALAKHGIAVTQAPDLIDGKFVLRTTLWMGDEKIESLYPLEHDKPQAIGSQLTYAKRQTLSALCCVCGDEDDDAEVAQTRATKPAKAPTPKANTLKKPEAEETPEEAKERAALHEATYRRCVEKLNTVETIEELARVWTDEGFQTDLKALIPDARQTITELKDSRKEALEQAEEAA